MDKHDKYEVVKQAWFEINEHLRNNKQDYIEYLKFSAKMYKQPYSDAVLVFQQDRNATKIAEYKKMGTSRAICKTWLSRRCCFWQKSHLQIFI